MDTLSWQEWYMYTIFEYFLKYLPPLILPIFYDLYFFFYNLIHQYICTGLNGNKNVLHVLHYCQMYYMNATVCYGNVRNLLGYHIPSSFFCFLIKRMILFSSNFDFPISIWRMLNKGISNGQQKTKKNKKKPNKSKW